MRLILHVGAHKTGTTSIQRLLHAQRGWFRDRGVIVPGPDPSLKRPEIPHHSFAHGLTGVDRAAEAASFAYADAAGRDARAAGAACVLISSEPIWRNIVGAAVFAELATPDYWPRREAYLGRLKRALAGFEVEPVVVLRRQDEFAESLHLAQWVGGRSMASFAEFLAVLAPTMAEYRRQIDLLQAVFGGVRVLSYHRLAATGRLVPAFLEALGLPVPDRSEDLWHFRSPEPRLLLWMDEMPGPRRTLRAFASSPEGEAVLAGPRASMWRDASERDAFLARYAEANRLIERDHPDPSGQCFFPDPRPMAGGALALGDQERERLTAAYRAWLQR